MLPDWPKGENENMENNRVGKILWTAQEVAEYLGRSKSAVYMMAYRRQLPFIKMGSGNSAIRFDKDEIVNIMESRKVEALKPVV